jgi:hypothetical protein
MSILRAAAHPKNSSDYVFVRYDRTSNLTSAPRFNARLLGIISGRH